MSAGFFRVREAWINADRVVMFDEADDLDGGPGVVVHTDTDSRWATYDELSEMYEKNIRSVGDFVTTLAENELV